MDDVGCGTLLLLLACVCVCVYLQKRYCIATTVEWHCTSHSNLTYLFAFGLTYLLAIGLAYTLLVCYPTNTTSMSIQTTKETDTMSTLVIIPPVIWTATNQTRSGNCSVCTDKSFTSTWNKFRSIYGRLTSTITSLHLRVCRT